MGAAAIVATLDAWEKRTQGRVLLSILLILTTLGLQRGRKGVGIDLKREEIKAALGETIETENFFITWDKKGGLSQRNLEKLILDHEFRMHQVKNFLQLTPNQKVHSYIFASAARKKQLIGAKYTQVSNPFRHELYIHHSRIPHRVLKHELVHAVSGQFGIPILGYSIKPGLIEGIAVAIDWTSNGKKSPHKLAATLLMDNKLPHPKDFLGFGFWSERQAKAYTSAGSFVRFLVDQYGAQQLLRTYPWGQFKKFYGKELSTLNQEWRKFLETFDIKEGEQKSARERFAAKSLFERPCARIAAELEESAYTALAKKDFSRAEQEFRQLSKFDTGPSAWRGLTTLYYKSKDYPKARRALEAWQSRETPDSAGALRALLASANLSWAEGDLPKTNQLYLKIYDKHLNSSLDRDLAIKLSALADPVQQTPLRPLLTGQETIENQMDALLATDPASPAGKVAHTLTGKYLVQKGALSKALRIFQAVDPTSLQDPSWRCDLLHMTGATLFELTHWSHSQAVFDDIRQNKSLSEECRARATDWIERVQWKRATLN